METTLSGNTYIRMMQRARMAGFEVRLLYVGTESVEINIERVKARVARGGHDVPEEDQRRRFPRSMTHLIVAMSLADSGVIFDNSTAEGHRAVAIKSDRGLKFFDPCPEWLVNLRDHLA